MNFGTLKDIFTEKLIESYTNDFSNGKELYKNFLKLLKENDVLKTSFLIFNKIENKEFDSEISAIEYIKECVSIFDKYRGDNSLKTNLNKMISLLESYDVDYENKKTKQIHDYIQDLLTTKKSITTLDKIHESQNNLVKFLLSNKKANNMLEGVDNLIRKDLDPKKFLNIVVNKFNNKYAESLTEEEKKIVKTLKENNKVKIDSLISDLIKENIKLVNGSLEKYNDNIKIKSKLLETKDVIYKMAENNDHPKDKVFKLYELKKTLNG